VALSHRAEQRDRRLAQEEHSEVSLARPADDDSSVQKDREFADATVFFHRGVRQTPASANSGLLHEESSSPGGQDTSEMLFCARPSIALFCAMRKSHVEN